MDNRLRFVRVLRGILPLQFMTLFSRLVFFICEPGLDIDIHMSTAIRVLRIARLEVV